MNCWPSHSNYMTTIYIYWIWELGTLGRQTEHTIFTRWNVWRPRATTRPQFLIYWIWELGTRAKNPIFSRWTVGHPQTVGHDHNLDILDLDMGTFGRHVKHTIFSRWTDGHPRGTTWPQFIYTGFENWAHSGDTLSTPYLAMNYWAFKSNYITISYIYWI